jgi:transcriptional regulator with XRE-family HTH domain
MTPKQMTYTLERLIRARGLTKLALAQELDITRPTLNRMLADPRRMRGDTRQRLARTLLVRIDLLDDLINGASTYTSTTVTDLITSKPQHHATTA